MSDLDDLRKRAAQQASTGNYWAGKCVALIDLYRSIERIREAPDDDWVNPVTGHGGDCGCISCHLSQTQ